MNYLISGDSPRRQGTAHPNIVPYQAFATGDGHVMLAVGNDRQFASLCTIAGRPELATDPRFRTNASRVAHRAVLVPELAVLLRGRTTAEWLAALGAVSVPCGPINDLAAVFAEPQVRHRALRFELPHPLAGQVPQIRSPVRYSRSVLEYSRPPPLLGEHTDSVLAAEADVGPQALASLRARGVIG
jgi:crotonobetainyl-CoA:carnitine CoA-transferase CaiB-like acyl-CoA transferase